MIVSLKSIIIDNGETMGYREREGGMIPLLLVHGNMTSSKHWDVLMEVLDPKYKVYAIDLRGFGMSSYHKRITSIKDFADDVKQFTDAMELIDFAMIGWSTGGAVAMQYCADFPDTRAKLILLASASTRGYPYFGHDLAEGSDGVVRYHSIEEIQQDALKTIPIQQAYDEQKGELLRGIWNAVIYTQNQPSVNRYDAYLEDMMTQRNLADVYHALNIFNISDESNGLAQGSNQAKDLSIPVLILRGDRDLVITEEMTNEIIEDLGGNALFLPLENCGHSPLIDNLSLLIEKIESFIGKVHVGGG
ncbi:intracellular short-chain-length polyhydroxyalkanoate depolymerase [Cytobacillus purgationiresistens]|uniref:Pimeloyl-ACP methyl ester carboxylesterase n=1 Tax=Cytobacillus purgationiresistens TaxID=863449 RepID=A0ABU0AEP9_9BACI|nr:alpha/beta hydrolase [Cytobacillus purgationiresistens]MDQ0268565.1 pimeloyl-ACP methyl ester carboxylesterase [Cytobacillus purgationiresistens]